MKNLAIGQAAAATGLSADTIRYYERRGTIPRSDRTDNGGAQPSVLRSQLSAIDGQMAELQAWRDAVEHALEHSAADATATS